MARFQEDYPEAVVFAQRDGLYWLSGADLRRFEAATGRRYDSQVVGFDGREATAHALDLMRKHVKVGIRQGTTFRLLNEPSEAPPPVPKTQAIFLMPELLIDRSELDRLALSLEKPTCRFRAGFERWRSILLDGGAEPVYVIRLYDSMYEVAWEWTGLSEESFTGLAVAADSLGRKLACRLIKSRPARPSPHVLGTEQVYGQLSLAFLSN